MVKTKVKIKISGVEFPPIFRYSKANSSTLCEQWIFKLKDNRNGISFPKNFLPTVRKNCYSGHEKNFKFEAEGQEFANILRSLEQFIQTVKGQYNF